MTAIALGPVMSRSDREALNRAFPGDGLLVAARHHGAPERGGRVVAVKLPHLPGTGKHREDPPCGLPAGSATAVLPQHEELAHVIDALGAHQGKARPPARLADQERMAVLVSTVVIAIPVAELSVLVYVIAVPLGKVVEVQLKQPPQDSLVAQRRAHQFD